MSVASSRAVLRHSRLLGRSSMRTNSTSAQASQAAADTVSKARATASSVTNKASQGLSRVTSSAGPVLSGAAQGAGKALRGVGGRTGRLVAFVDSLVPPAVYYAKVGRELAKIVFHAQKMTPPPLATFQSYAQPLIQAARNPRTLLDQTASSSNTLNPAQLLGQLRNTSPQQLATAGVIAAEVLGFFKVGEMVGRFKVVGYRGDKAEHH
ncbi:MAG: hypothetical protein M1832_003798 [Thelocarpon impressellum]|nr:MAG: hypothetical protein M1832_003798 [Thelocarpon impressellum]